MGAARAIYTGVGGVPDVRDVKGAVRHTRSMAILVLLYSPPLLN